MPLQGSLKQAKRAEAAGRLRGYRRRLREYKERPHREAAAETTLAEKDHVLAAICHDLRAPLNAITGWARVACTAPAGGAELDEALARIESSARLQATLINDILDLVRERQRDAPDRSPSCESELGR
jgi:signal transduction histidine kinase